MASNPMILKLCYGAVLSDADRERLEAASKVTRSVERDESLISEGDNPENVRVVLSGWACRHKTLASGRRSIMAYLVPGDFCDLHVAVLGRMDHSISAITRCTIAEIPHATVNSLTNGHPSIARAFWWATLVDESVLREWLVNLGQRPAAQRLAHFLCEMHIRLSAVELAAPNSFTLPLSQEKLGDTLALSTVHMNRTVRELRERGLISIEEKTVTIADVCRLRDFANFEPEYLHLKGVRVPQIA